MKLSILTPTTPRRVELMGSLAETINEQCEGRPVEHIWIGDNETISIGQKINAMVKLALGEYVTVVADDDMVMPNYVEEILRAIDMNPLADLICFDTEYYIADKGLEDFYPDKPNYIIKEGAWYEDKMVDGVLYRPASDKMCWRRSIRLAAPCIHSWDRSDSEFAKVACPMVRSEVQLEKALYQYYYNQYSPCGKHYRRELDRKWASMDREFCR